MWNICFEKAQWKTIAFCSCSSTEYMRTCNTFQIRQRGGQSLSERIQVDLAPCIGNFCFFISIQMTAVYSGWRKSEGSHRNLKIVWYTHFCSWYHISKSLHLNAAVLSYNWGALCNLCWIVYGHSWHAFAALHSISCGITEPLMKQNGCW